MTRFIDFGAKESITTGIFTALILFLHLALLMLLHFLPGVLVLFKESIVALVTGPVYVLLITKVPRRGVFTVCGFATAVTYWMFGFLTVGVVTALGGFLADNIAFSHGFRNPARNTAAYIVFSLSKAVGTYIPFYLWGNAFVESLLAMGKGNEAFIAIFTTNLSLSMGLGIVAANAVCAALGFMLGYRMLRTHFTRAGVA